MNFIVKKIFKKFMLYIKLIYNFQFNTKILSENLKLLISIKNINNCENEIGYNKFKFNLILYLKKYLFNKFKIILFCKYYYPLIYIWIKLF